MAAAFPPLFTARPNLTTCFYSQFSPPPQVNPPAPSPPPPDPPPDPNHPTVSSSSNPISSIPPTTKSVFPFPPPKSNPPISGTIPTSRAAALIPPPVKWTNLFASKPRNAGSFSPPSMALKFSGKRLVPTEDIVSAAEEVWSDYLVGFFLDKPLCFTVVSYYLSKNWKLKGSIKIKSNGKVFFLLFSDHEDRQRIVEADPLYIRGKIFIIKPWSATFNLNANCIRNVPVWIKITEVPLIAWTLPGITWLASRIGKCLCLDYYTEKLERLEYAKCMIEITPDSEMPSDFLVLLPDGSEQSVKIEYMWKPEACSLCKVFGHQLSNCQNNIGKTAAKEMGGKVGTYNSKTAVLPNMKIGPSRVSKVDDKYSKEEWSRVNRKNNSKTSLNEPPLADQDARAKAAGKAKVCDNNINFSNMFGALDNMYENLRSNEGLDSTILSDEEGEILADGDKLQGFVENGNSGKAKLSEVECEVDDAVETREETQTRLNPMQELLNDVIEAAKVANHEVNLAKNIAMENDVSKQVNGQDTQNVADKLDDFLLENFDVVQANHFKERTKIVYGENVQQSIERLRTELASGLVSDVDRVDKNEILETLIKSLPPNHSMMRADDNVIEKQSSFSNPVSPPITGFKPGFLNTKSPISVSKAVNKNNPYAHLIPPLAFRAPPVMCDASLTQGATSSSAETVKTPLTRSRQRELMRAQYEKG